MTNAALIGYYALFSLICFCVFVFDNWDAGEDTQQRHVFAFAVMSVFPVMNVICLFNAVVEIIERRMTGVMLKGKAK